MQATIHQGDALAVLKTLPAESVHTCVTSPPYWGLRSYHENAVRLDPKLSEEKKQEVLRELERRGIDARL